MTHSHLSTDIDATLKETEHIVDCLNMPSKEEAYILKGYKRVRTQFN